MYWIVVALNCMFSSRLECDLRECIVSVQVETCAISLALF